jgi:tetratricopeptide (TPR) repeat protein
MQLYLAEIHSLMNNPKNAAIFYDSALNILSRKLIDDPDNPVLQSHMGIAFAGKGDREKAITAGIKAIDMYEYDNFDKSDMIINLAVIYTMVRDFEQASTWVGVLLYRIPSELSDKLLEINPIWESLIKWPEFRIYLEKAQKTKISRQA